MASSLPSAEMAESHVSVARVSLSNRWMDPPALVAELRLHRAEFQTAEVRRTNCGDTHDTRGR